MTQNAYALFWRDYRFGWRETEGKDESMEGIGGKSPPGTPLLDDCHCAIEINLLLPCHMLFLFTKI